MTADPLANGDDGVTWTVDDLARASGFTVRTIRYYSTLGLLPPPERRGRVAFYDERHRARLDLVKTLQEQGFNLSAIEQHVSRLREDAPAAEIEMRRVLATSWAPIPPAVVDRAGLEKLAGRALSREDLDRLERFETVRAVEGGYAPSPTFGVGVRLLDLDLPFESMEAAGAVIRRHMDAMVLELREVLRTQVLAPLRTQHEHDMDPAAFERTMTQLRQLTLDSVVGHFHQAANALADGTLLERSDRDS